MPTLDENLRIWDREHRWPQGGDEWSEAWGSARAQWLTTLLPRIAGFLPARTILEIAPGHGRWSQFLVGECEELTLVDLSPSCIEACRARFADRPKVRYLVNDGRSLAGVPDESIDFAFSFDSLVHVEPDILRSYFAELGRTLRRGGAAFVHHSNLGAYRRHLTAKRWVVRLSRGRSFLGNRLIHDCLRDPSTTAEMVRGFVAAAGLRCVSQEIVPWTDSVQPIDCLTVVKHDDSPEPPRVVVNKSFLDEAKIARGLARLY
jgi:hypothetical protein